MSERKVISLEEIKQRAHGTIIGIPDWDNSEEKISPYGTIVTWGSKCHYKYEIGQRVMIDRFKDKPQYLECEGKKYRIIKEHYLHAVLE